ncbi:MAG TPA: PGPGW domain-containing protein [Magnetospirillum sp.]|nr:PGPGW domain-containing protein [Magnetospirillum sp.]
MSPRASRLIKIVVGWFFLVLGVLGLFLPILQGVLFLAIGLAILASEQVWAHRLLTWLKRRFPRFAKQFDQARHQSERWGHKLLHRRGKSS